MPSPKQVDENVVLKEKLIKAIYGSKVNLGLPAWKKISIKELQEKMSKDDTR